MGRLIRGESITVQRATTSTDDYGDTVRSWASPTTTTVDNVAVAPTDQTEDNQSRAEGTVTGLTLYLPTGTDIEPTDRVVVRGDTYEVRGEVADWRSPYSGDRPGLTVNVRRVDG